MRFFVYGCVCRQDEIGEGSEESVHGKKIRVRINKCCFVEREREREKRTIQRTGDMSLRKRDTRNEMRPKQYFTSILHDFTYFVLVRAVVKSLIATMISRSIPFSFIRMLECCRCCYCHFCCRTLCTIVDYVCAKYITDPGNFLLLRVSLLLSFVFVFPFFFFSVVVVVVVVIASSRRIYFENVRMKEVCVRA